MQLLTAAPRDGLTEAQVRRLLVGAPGVAYERGCELLDADLTVVEDISADLLGGEVIHTAYADVHGTCTLKLARDIDYGTQLVRPYLTLSAEGVSARFYSGAFVLHKPLTEYGWSPVTNTTDGSDRLFLLNRPAGAYTVDAGTGYLDALRQAVEDAGLDPDTVLLDGTKASAVLPTAKTWPLLSDDPDRSGPTTWLQIINDLLEAIAYRGLWMDEFGQFRSEPYIAPVLRTPEFEFVFDDDYEAIIAPARTKALDLSKVPNVWVFLQQNLVDGSGDPIEPVEGAGQYTVTNVADGPTSIAGRGGLEWMSVVQLDAADQVSLEAQGDQRVSADRRVTQVHSVSTAPFPAAGHFDVYTYSDSEAAGGAVKVMETGWTLDLGDGDKVPADMARTWEVVA